MPVALLDQLRAETLAPWTEMPHAAELDPLGLCAVREVVLPGAPHHFVAGAGHRHLVEWENELHEEVSWPHVWLAISLGRQLGRQEDQLRGQVYHGWQLIPYQGWQLVVGVLQDVMARETARAGVGRTRAKGKVDVGLMEVLPNVLRQPVALAPGYREP